MHEILFRGKRQGSTVWVLGFYNEFANPKTGEQESFIQTVKPDGRIDVIHKVEPETVGQYTGLQDKNGKRIFSGDIVRFQTTGSSFSPLIVTWRDADARFVVATQDRSHSYPMNKDWTYETLGNIHDNPELIKEGK